MCTTGFINIKASAENAVGSFRLNDKKRKLPSV